MTCRFDLHRLLLAAEDALALLCPALRAGGLLDDLSRVPGMRACGRCFDILLPADFAGTGARTRLRTALAFIDVFAPIVTFGLILYIVQLVPAAAARRIRRVPALRTSGGLLGNNLIIMPEDGNGRGADSRAAERAGDPRFSHLRTGRLPHDDRISCRMRRF